MITFGLDGPVIEFRWERGFRYPSIPTPRSPVKSVPDLFPGGKAACVRR